MKKRRRRRRRRRYCHRARPPSPHLPSSWSPPAAVLALHLGPHFPPSAATPPTQRCCGFVLSYQWRSIPLSHPGAARPTLRRASTGASTRPNPSGAARAGRPSMKCRARGSSDLAPASPEEPEKLNGARGCHHQHQRARVKVASRSIQFTFQSTTQSDWVAGGEGTQWLLDWSASLSAVSSVEGNTLP